MSGSGIPRIAEDWLSAPPLRRVFAALTAGGAEVRVAGGAVRNSLTGRAVTEVDLATTALPGDVVRLAKAGGLGVYPTGIDHGTVTVVADGAAFEVTTLRRDVATDGRHAVVAFSRDWREDARRRDFTINAIYCTADGRVFDPVDGVADLAARRVRFIGDPQQRIREDYLRILRFFRFTADYAKGDADAAGLAACTALKDGLSQLSGERIGAEMTKLLAAPRAGEICKTMADAGILELVLGGCGHAGHLIHMQAIELGLGVAPDTLARLAVLLPHSAGAATDAARRLRLSNADADAIAAATAVNPAIESNAPELAQKAAIYRLGADPYKRAVKVAWARSAAPATDLAWRSKFLLAERWRPPAMAVTGTDVLALGVPAGPRVGVILKCYEDWWIGQDFPADSAVQRAQLAALAKQA